MSYSSTDIDLMSFKSATKAVVGQLAKIVRDVKDGAITGSKAIVIVDDIKASLSLVRDEMPDNEIVVSTLDIVIDNCNKALREVRSTLS